MRILLLGRNGQLGWELHRTLSTFGEVLALDYPEIDFCRIKDLIDITSEIQPALIINAGAYTDVDRAESEADKAFLINGTAPAALNEYAQNHRIPFIHYSTDYVFDGMKGSPYTEEDIPNPLNVYGASKLAGERGIQDIGGKYLIFRTSWVYSNRKGGYVNKVRDWAKTQKILRIVTDQVGNPTWARMLAEATARVVDKLGNRDTGWREDLWGLYNLAGEGYCSRYEWAEEILKIEAELTGNPVNQIEKALTKEFPSPVSRPKFSALECTEFANKAGFQLPDWKVSQCLCLQA